MTNFLIFLAIIAGVAAVSIWLNKRSTPKGDVGKYPAEPAEEKTIFTNIMDWETNNVFIAGLEHHCTKNDVGWFTGKIFPEPENKYDKKAMAVGSNQAKKILGYIPAAVLKEYRAWCKSQDCRCVGYIFFDGEHLRGRVRAYLPDSEPEKVVKDVESYIKQAAEHFGWDIDGAQIEI